MTAKIIWLKIDSLDVNLIEKKYVVSKKLYFCQVRKLIKFLRLESRLFSTNFG
jgi:hypothetical protein